MAKAIYHWARDIVQVSLTLFRILIPTLIVIKILEELGAVVWISWLLSPVMSAVGLPESAALIWATTMLTNLYAGMVIFFTQAPSEGWTVAQVSVLATMMLLAHNLVIEGRIAQRAGVNLGFTLGLRIGGALVLGALLNWAYQSGGWLQQPNVLAWQPDHPQDSSWLGWLQEQLLNLWYIFLVIAALISLLRLLRWLKVEALMSWLLQPLLRLLGIRPQATSMTIIGMTLGLAYGGGLLIREAEQGQVNKQDVFAAICLLGLCHSLIEDTLLMLALGADLSAILWTRLAFSLAILAWLTRWAQRRPEPFVERFLVRSVAKGS